MEKTITELEASKKAQRPLRLAAYVRVSSNSEDQRHSFAAQVKYYTEYIAAHPEYELADIYADEGVTGTRMDKRDDFNRLLRDCKKRRVDRIITKSVSRFARNTTELLTVVRALREIGVSIYFEEQGIDTETIDLEMLLTFPGMAAQKESETISDNMRWSYQKRMESGEFNCCRAAYGYDLIDGQLQINEAEAAVVRRIFDLYLQGFGKQAIANQLNAEGAPRRYGQKNWYLFAIDYILNNERYMGDALLQKSYTTDVLPFRKKRNHGEKAQYYVENNHPAIIDAATFARVQEELARRASKRKVKQVGTKTEQGRYSSKYALTELLVCEECGTPYRRCTWTVSGKKKIVWRCISRLDYGKRYCHHSPTMEEAPLQEAIMNAVQRTAQANPDVLKTLKMHIQLGLGADDNEDQSVETQIRITEIDREFKEILNSVTAENQQQLLTDPRIAELMAEKRTLESKLAEYNAAEQNRKNAASRLEQIFTILDGMKNHPLAFDDQVIRQILQCVVVESKEKIRVVFTGGLEVEAEVEQ